MLLVTRITSVARCSRKLAGRKDRLWEERKVLRQEITVMALAIGLKAPMQIFRCSRNGKKLRVQQLLLLDLPPLPPSGVLEKEAPAAVELALGTTKDKGTCSKEKVDRSSRVLLRVLRLP